MAEIIKILLDCKKVIDTNHFKWRSVKQILVSNSFSSQRQKNLVYYEIIMMHRRCWASVHCTTSCKAQSNVPEDGRNYRPKHVDLFILVINQLDAQSLIYNKFISSLYMFRAPCAHRQEVKIVLYSLWYHHTYRWPSRARESVESVSNQSLSKLVT